MVSETTLEKVKWHILEFSFVSDNSQWVGGCDMDQSMVCVAKEKQILFQEFQVLPSPSTCGLSLAGCYLDDFDTETF